MAKGKATPTPFVRTPQPILDGGADAYVQREMQAIQTSIDSILPFIPCAANAPPERLYDGMIRLSRRPWYPIGSNKLDEWVYYDAVGKTWRLLSAAPTDSL